MQLLKPAMHFSTMGINLEKPHDLPIENLQLLWPAMQFSFKASHRGNAFEKTVV
jgi:hypothetical protein